MGNLQIVLIAAAVALGVLVVLGWIFAPRPKLPAPAPRASGTAGAAGAWDGAARRRRDLASSGN